MTLHIHGTIATAYGIAANNRGMTEGNISTLQKIIWKGKEHTTVSAESIRLGLRKSLEDLETETCNRSYDDDSRANTWKNKKHVPDEYIDDDGLGYMTAEGAKTEKEKGSCDARRSRLELSRAISMSAFAGDVSFNAASPGATESAQKKGSNPVPYGTEMHATRYQFGFSITPAGLKKPIRAKALIKAICNLGNVGGNHARFMYSFAAESAVFLLTHCQPSRLQFGLDLDEDQDKVNMREICRLVRVGDIKASELVIGGAVVASLSKEDRELLKGAHIFDGVIDASEYVCSKLDDV